VIIPKRATNKKEGVLMTPAGDLDWLSILLITATPVPALGATVFGFFVFRRRGSLPAYSATASTHTREAPSSDARS
jgi:hypothetical protein